MKISNGVKSLLRKFVPKFLVDFYHYFLSLASAFLYGFSGYKINPVKYRKAVIRKGELFNGVKVIGVTGTQGKSTTAILIGRILEEASFKVGWVNSATIKIDEKERLNPYHMTMPGRFFLQKFLRQAKNSGCQYVVLEVTSEGIKQHRHRFINFDTAVFTNLKPEHIEAHAGFENYRKAKGKLFNKTKKIHILNLDDENIDYFLQFPAEKKIGFTVRGEQFSAKAGGELFSVIEAKNTQLLPSGIKFSVNNIEFNLNLLGEFNVYNALAAISTGLSQGIGLKVCCQALEKVKGIPGRMEFIEQSQNFKVLVDLAHTPDAFEKVFVIVKNMTKNKIISVFGSAGGGRDKWKRPELGKIAAKNSDFIILCNEDPYDENPLSILEEIEKGFSQVQSSCPPEPLAPARLRLRANSLAGGQADGRRAKFKVQNYEKILDRREAIRKALSLARPNDIVLILGKGTEQTMVIGDKKIKWDDRQVVREEIKR